MKVSFFIEPAVRTGNTSTFTRQIELAAAASAVSVIISGYVSIGQWKECQENGIGKACSWVKIGTEKIKITIWTNQIRTWFLVDNLFRLFFLVKRGEEEINDETTYEQTPGSLWPNLPHSFFHQKKHRFTLDQTGWWPSTGLEMWDLKHSKKAYYYEHFECADKTDQQKNKKKDEDQDEEERNGHETLFTGARQAIKKIYRSKKINFARKKTLKFEIDEVEKKTAKR